MPPSCLKDQPTQSWGPLHLAVHLKAADAVRSLLSTGADPCKLDTLGRSAYSYAVDAPQVQVCLLSARKWRPFQLVGWQIFKK